MGNGYYNYRFLEQYRSRLRTCQMYFLFSDDLRSSIAVEDFPACVERGKDNNGFILKNDFQVMRQFE